MDDKQQYKKKQLSLHLLLIWSQASGDISLSREAWTPVRFSVYVPGGCPGEDPGHAGTRQKIDGGLGQ